MCCFVCLQKETRERYAVGAILTEGSETADPEMTEIFNRAGYKPFRLPIVENVVKTSCPHTSAFSVAFGRARAYPQINQYVKVSYIPHLTLANILFPI